MFSNGALSEQAFYAQKSYAERVTDNVAGWLGLPHVSLFDVVLLATLAPAMAIVISWWLPWERWLFQRLARMIAGPYCLYCAVVIWHFQARWWAIAMVAILGAILCGLAIRERRRASRRG